MGTHYPKKEEIQREWLLVDLDGATVGRAASQIASLLRGKHKTTFTPHLDVGDFVVCINAEKVKFTGNKLTQQTYNKFTGYLGNMKTATAAEILERKPELVIKQAVKRMLPKTDWVVPPLTNLRCTPARTTPTRLNPQKHLSWASKRRTSWLLIR